jgi:hypothetical protein
VPSFGILVARDTCEEKEDGMKRAVFLATVAFLAMLILVRMALAQGTDVDDSASPPPAATTMVNGSVVTVGAAAGGGGNMGTTMVNGSASPIPSSGGSDILLPAAALLLGSGILTYAVLRRR